MNPLFIAPSVLSADLAQLGNDLKLTEECGANWHHVDVMDGHFVPNLSYGLPVVKTIKRVSKLPLDVHIMIANPDEFAHEYIKAGADVLSFHIEASKHPYRLAQSIRDQGALAGISINPGTALQQLAAVLEVVDVINIMSVNPGFGGQKFIMSAIKRVETLANIREKNNQSFRIEVDGGINAETAKSVVSAGADTLVAGSYVYGAKDRKAAIEAMRQL